MHALGEGYTVQHQNYCKNSRLKHCAVQSGSYVDKKTAQGEIISRSAIYLSADCETHNSQYRILSTPRLVIYEADLEMFNDFVPKQTQDVCGTKHRL